LRTGDLSDADWNRAQEAFGYLASAKIYIDDNPTLTVMDIRARARRIKSTHGDLGVVIIDYLQLMTGRSRAENRQVEVSEMSRALKILARELGCPVIALSQLSRALETRQEKRPMMSDLRESGSLEQDADVILFLYRAEKYGEVANDKKSEVEVIVAKNRNGPTDKAFLTFRDEFARFDNVLDSSNF
jgi:replicative DNA helicase